MLRAVTISALMMMVFGVACASSPDGGPAARGPLRARTAIAVVVVEQLTDWQKAAMADALARTGLPVHDVTVEHGVLMSPDLHERIGNSAPDDWPPEAAAAWEAGAAACRERAGRPPWGESEIARLCARELGPAVFDALLDAKGARVMFLSPPPGSASLPPDRPWYGTSYVPDEGRERSAKANIKDLIPLLVAGGGSDGRDLRRPALPTPPALDDPALKTGPFMPFDAVQVAGCKRPLPNALDVEPVSAMGNMIEHAWSTLPASARTGPKEKCELRAFTTIDPDNQLRELVGARILCPSLPLAASVKRAPSGFEDGIIDELAKMLVDQIAFGGCNLDNY